MTKKLLSLALSALLLNLCWARPVLAAKKDAAARQQAAEQKAVEKVKKKVAGVGTGKRASVEVKLRDETKLVGYITEIADDHFVLTDEKRVATTSVSYAEVKQIRRTFIMSKFQKGVTLAAIPLGVLMVAALVTLVVKGGE